MERSVEVSVMKDAPVQFLNPKKLMTMLGTPSNAPACFDLIAGNRASGFLCREKLDSAPRIYSSLASQIFCFVEVLRAKVRPYGYQQYSGICLQKNERNGKYLHQAEFALHKRGVQIVSVSPEDDDWLGCRMHFTHRVLSACLADAIQIRK